MADNGIEERLDRRRPGAFEVQLKRATD